MELSRLRLFVLHQAAKRLSLVFDSETIRGTDSQIDKLLGVESLPKLQADSASRTWAA